jgi:Pirin C-terminal cupin domain
MIRFAFEGVRQTSRCSTVKARAGGSSPVPFSASARQSGFQIRYYVDMTLAAGASVPLDPEYDERAIYTVEGDIEIAGDSFLPGALLVFHPGDRITIRAKSRARFMMLGGERWMVRITSGGISSRRAKNVSTRLRLGGSRHASIPSGRSRVHPAPPTRAADRGSEGRELSLIQTHSASPVRVL